MQKQNNHKKQHQNKNTKKREKMLIKLEKKIDLP
jgi:hypothetical protein